MGTIIVVIFILILLSVIFRLKGRKGERKMLNRDREVFEAEIVDSPLDVTERSLVAKRDRALERASRKAGFTWSDRRALRKDISQGLLSLTRQTGEDVREALAEKLRSDLNLFINAHELKNLASLERLRLAYEETLSEACLGSTRRRAQGKAAAIIDMVESISRKHDELERHCRGRETYKARAEEAFSRIFEDTLQSIEAMHVSLKSRRHFAE